MSAITTHVLDATTGSPAAGMAVRLDACRDGGWYEIGTGSTDADGRLPGISPDRLLAGDYRLIFGTGEWFAAAGRVSFYPEVTVTFTITDPDRHHHVPLLLSAFAYSTYRGS